MKGEGTWRMPIYGHRAVACGSTGGKGGRGLSQHNTMYGQKGRGLMFACIYGREAWLCVAPIYGQKGRGFKVRVTSIYVQKGAWPIGCSIHGMGAWLSLA